ncbi:MAG: MAP7 domain-containing protein [Fulvivirga sp.]|nr:MAP7 domain-containing protein [Fulvivirga sp.]
MGIFTFLGVVLIIATTALMILNYRLKKAKERQLSSGTEAYRNVPGQSILAWFTVKRGFLLFGLGLILLFNSLFLFYARPGHQYFIVSPTGTKSAIFSSGIKFITPMSKVQEWQKFIDIKVITGDEPVEGIEGVIPNGIPIRFIDQVTAEVNLSVRMQMPQDEPSFIKLAEEFRHPRNLTNNTLVPTVKEQVINTGYMFAAQDYISGSAADFRQTLDEQLKNGGYSVEKKEYYDTIYAEIQQKQRVIKDIRTRYEVNKRLDETGTPVRVDHDITKNNIIVSQVIVDQVNLEDAFKRRLEAQRDISAQKRIEMEKIETAKAEQQRILAEGERDKTAERANQEKEQVKKLIEIETRLKQEETNKKLAQIQLETERLKAQAKKVAADAQSYENAKLVQAGLTPQERAEWDYKTSVGVAEKLAGPNGITLPQMYMGGGNNGKSNNTDALQQIMTMMMAQQSLKSKGGK